MDLYTKTSYALSEELTLRYSTSFSKSTRLFTPDVRLHVFAIYGLVRIADEIVDTYAGVDAAQQLDNLEKETKHAIKMGYSANPLVHAFATTSASFQFDQSLIRAFFTSMRMDLTKRTYTQKEYDTYIYGSAEVIGLMCLALFTHGNAKAYAKLAPAARALGAAYQKVNFLRDFAEDYTQRERVYFPGVSFESFNDDIKDAIVHDIYEQFHIAERDLHQLPKTARTAVETSIVYYKALLTKLEATPASTIKSTRIRIPNHQKMWLALTKRQSLRGNQ